MLVFYTPKYLDAICSVLCDWCLYDKTLVKGKLWHTIWSGIENVWTSE